jgi:hypothetical protein
MRMANQTILSGPGLYKNSLLRSMPAWFDKKGCTFIEGATDVYLNFFQRCSRGEMKQSVYVGKTKRADRAAKLAAAVSKKHGICQTVDDPPTAEESIDVAQAEIARLDRAVTAQRKRAGKFEAEIGLLKRKHGEVKAYAAQVALKTTARKKRAPIVHSNEEAFGAGMLSHRLLAPAEQPGGVVQTLEYHCEGSRVKLLDIVTYLIKRYNLNAETLKPDTFVAIYRIVVHLGD